MAQSPGATSMNTSSKPIFYNAGVSRPQSFVLALAVSATLISCTKKQESATINLVMPQSISNFDNGQLQKTEQKALQKMVQNVSRKTVSASSSQELPDWNTALNPTAGSQINCFAVFVGGPNLSGNSCSVTDSGVEREITFGPHIGFVPSGATVRLEVPAGPDRVFHVIGLRSATAAACSSFQNTEIDETNLSEPFLIASQRADIPAGESTLNIVASLNVDKKISTCSFVNGGGGGGGGGTTTITFGNTNDGSLSTTSGNHYLFQYYTAVGTPSPGLMHTPKSGGVPSTKILGSDRRVTEVATTGAYAGRLLKVATPFTANEFDVGDEVIWHVSSGNAIPGPPDDPVTGACGGGLYLGRYGFAKIEAVTATDELRLSTSIAENPGQVRNSLLAAPTNFSPGFCRIAITRVSNFDEIDIENSSSLDIFPKAFDQEQGTGGTLVLRAKRLDIDGTLTLSATGRGFLGGAPTYSGNGLSGFGGFGLANPAGNGGGALISAVGGGGGAGAGEGGLEGTPTGRPRGGTPLTHGQAESFASISGGNLHSCGITTSGRVKCFGDGQSLQLGMGPTLASVFSTPHAIDSSGSFTSVVAGYRHSCALRNSDRFAFCWGLGSSGQLGHNAVTSSGVPIAANGARAYSQITASPDGNFTCAVAASTPLGYCWGEGSGGQLGNSSLTDRLIPTAISGGFLFKKISAGQSHACGVTTGNQVYCWGNNGSGRLGDGSQTSTTVPILIDTGVTYKDVAAGGSHTCGITSTDDVKCWGSGSFGQLGTGAAPSFILVPTAANTGGIKYKSITAGTVHTCALSLTDDIYCWGHNISGQLGDSTFTSRSEPTLIPGGIKFKQVSAGSTHACAVHLNNQTSYCWGNSESGQLGIGGFTNQSTPGKVRDQLYPLPVTEQKTFNGGGGGSGDQYGGNGGGIILVYAKEIRGSGNLSITAKGSNGLGTAVGGGGGGGGTIGLASRRIEVASISLFANGGDGKAGFSSGGGGGGAIEVLQCNAQSSTTPMMFVSGGIGSGVSFGGAYGVLKLENLEPLCSLD